MIAVLSQLAIGLTNEVSVGNLLTLGTIIAAVGSAWASLKGKSEQNREAIKEVRTDVDTFMKGFTDGGIALKVDMLWSDRETLWKFHRQRGELEAEVKGLVRRNSPAMITGAPREKEVRQAYQSLMVDLQQIAFVDGKDLDHDLLFPLVASKLGDKLANDVCKSLGVEYDVCVSLAITLIEEIREHANEIH